MQPLFLGQFFPFLSPFLGQVPPSTLQRAPTRRAQAGVPQGGVFTPHFGAVSRQDAQTEPQNPERAMKQPQSTEQPQHSQDPVAARGQMIQDDPSLLTGQPCSHQDTECPLSGDARAWAWGQGGPARCSTPGARWFCQSTQPCLPPQAGSDPTEINPSLCWVQNPGYAIGEKHSFFLLSLFPKFSANTSLFHHWGNADLPAPLFSPFTKFKPRESSANALVLHRFLFAKSSKPSPKAAGAHRTAHVPAARGM